MKMSNYNHYISSALHHSTFSTLMSPVTHADIKMYMNAHVGCGTDILVTQMMISTK